MVILCKEGNASKYAKEACDAGKYAVDCMKDTLPFKQSDRVAQDFGTDVEKVYQYPQKLFDKILNLNAEHRFVELFVELDDDIIFSLWMFMRRNGIHHTFQPGDFSQEEIDEIIRKLRCIL